MPLKMVINVGCSIVIAICLLSMHQGTASGHHILLLPFPWPSHFTQMEIIGIELEKRGHNVTIAVPSSEGYMDKTPLKRIVYKVTSEQNAFVSIAERRLKTKEEFGLTWLSEFCKLVAEFCSAAMVSDEITTALKAADIIVSDTAFFAAPSIGTYHKTPWVLLSPFGHMAGLNGDLLGAAGNPSYVPMYVATAEFEKAGPNQHMSFMERSFNLLARVITWIARHLIINKSMESLSKKYGIDSIVTLTMNTELILVPMDYAFEYPRMDPPNIKMIGPLTPLETDEQLKAPFSEIVMESDTRILMVSLGITNALNDKDALRLLETFQSINYTVIMKYNTTVAKSLTKTKGAYAREMHEPRNVEEIARNKDKNAAAVKKCCITKDEARNASTAKRRTNATLTGRERPSSYKKCKTTCTVATRSSFFYPRKNCSNYINKVTMDTIERSGGVRLQNFTYIFNYLPQQKLLQYSQKIILFTHCGTNSVYEALYHAKLLICMPLFGDQFDNAGRVLSRKVGRVIYLADLNKERLQKELKIFTEDKTYLENIKKISKRLRRREIPPVEMAAFWIEAVLEEEGDMSYLKPASAKMPWHVYLCLDVISFWSLSLVCLCWLVRFLYKKMH